MADDSGFSLGPQSGVTYPIQVLYCGNCSLPIEVGMIELVDRNLHFVYVHMG
jgi:hypothetical protein